MEAAKSSFRYVIGDVAVESMLLSAPRGSYASDMRENFAGLDVLCRGCA